MRLGSAPDALRRRLVFALRAVGGLGYEVSGWGLWVAPILGTVMYVWGGKPFLVGGWDEIRSRQPGMMLLISLGITVAFVASFLPTPSTTSAVARPCSPAAVERHAAIAPLVG